MDLGATHSWTLGGIVGSFFDLVLAYFLLCGSALVFFGSKVCNLFGLYMPCPCSGIFGYRNKDLCLHKLFVQWPLMIISHVQMLAKSRFPFNYVLSNDQPSDLNVNLNREGEASCGSVSGTKGKRFVNQKQRSGVRRRRRLEYGKLSPAVLSGSSRSVVGVPIFPFNGNDMRNEINPNLGHVDGGEDDHQGNEVFASPTSIDMSERSWYSLQRTLSFEENKDEYASSISKPETKTEDKPDIFLNEAKTITLEQALEEERAACAALQLELEKERAAAASATDEAMAMILRLQKEKAALEMEAMHYQRLIEEKFAHDEDEMSVLKEILIRRERENHFLEKELEAYKDDLKNATFDGEDEERLGKNVGSSVVTVEPIVHDVHVIDNETELHEEKKGHLCEQFVDFNRESKSSLSGVGTDGVEVDVEVEQLRQMLRIAEDGKEELSEREKTQLELLKEMVNRLQEAQHLRTGLHYRLHLQR